MGDTAKTRTFLRGRLAPGRKARNGKISAIKTNLGVVCKVHLYSQLTMTAQKANE